MYLPRLKAVTFEIKMLVYFTRSLVHGAGSIGCRDATSQEMFLRMPFNVVTVSQSAYNRTNIIT